LRREVDPAVAQLSAELELSRLQIYTLANNPVTTTSMADLRITMGKFRDTKSRLTALLSTAEKDLQAVLTMRQEALLLGEDFLD
jgi:hypothetical protein